MLRLEDPEHIKKVNLFWIQVLEYLKLPINEIIDKISSPKLKSLKATPRSSPSPAPSFYSHSNSSNVSVNSTHSLVLAANNSQSTTSSAPNNLIAESDLDSNLYEEFWFSFRKEDADMSCLRFLIARKWNVTEAVKMLMECLIWRKRLKVRELLMGGESLIKESLLSSGESFCHGLDKQGRLVTFVTVKHHDKNKQTLEELQDYTIYLMETARLLLPAGTSTVTVVFDMADFSLKCMDYPAVKFMLNCFQNYYPESLGCCLIVNSPWIFEGCWRLIKPWIDPVVCAKISFIKADELDKYVVKQSRPISLGGQYEFKWRSEASNNNNADNMVSSERVAVLTESIMEIAEKLTENILNSDDIYNKERQVLKKDLTEITMELESITHPSSFYHREGFLKNYCEPVWNAA